MSSAAKTWTKIVGYLMALAGVIMLIAGIVAWNIVGGELASQKINVAAEGQSENIANGPFDALSQINLIKEHTSTQMSGPVSEGGFGFPEGTTYSQVPRPDGALLAQCRAAQAAPDAAAPTTECQEAMTNDAARTYLDNSNSKQASLYTSVLAFGVAFLVIGLGLCFMLIGSAGIVATSSKRATKENAPAHSKSDKAPVTV